MIKPEQIPDEVAFALLNIYTLWLGDTDQARAAIAAALNAWPGVCKSESVIGLSKWIELPIEEQS